MTPGAVYLVLDRLAKQAGIDPFSPHDLRRTFVSQLLERGADLALIQKLAGHAQISTTSKYDRRDEKALARAVELMRIPC
jgi:site-specific recombinase XerD